VSRSDPFLPRHLVAGAILVLFAGWAACSACHESAPLDAGPALTMVSLATGNTSIPVGQSDALLANASYANGATADVTGEASWSSSDPAVAYVNGGIVSGLAEGGAEITASFGGMSATVQITVTPPGPDNEPAGFTLLTEHPFNTVYNTDGAGTGVWYGGSGGGSGLNIINDPTAPRSPPGVAQFTYPTGFAAGSAPDHIIFDVPPNLSQLYVSFWMKLSSQFQGEDSETNKVFYFWINSDPSVFLSNQGSGTTAPLMPIVRYQGSFDTRAHFNQNVGSGVPMTRGQWRHWELLLITNTPGQANGVFRWWIDGQKVGDYTDVRLRNSTNTWQYVYLQPIWGGVGSTVRSTQYLWIDHLRVSGQQ
jgi:hypothetical protein